MEEKLNLILDSIADVNTNLKKLSNDMNEKLEALEKRFDEKLEELEKKFNQKIEALNQKVDALEKKFNQKIEALDQKINEVDEKGQARHDNLVAEIVQEIRNITEMCYKAMDRKDNEVKKEIKMLEEKFDSQNEKEYNIFTNTLDKLIKLRKGRKERKKQEV